MALKSNIKTFNMKYQPEAYSNFLGSYNQNVERVNPILVNNQEAMEIFRGVAGSPLLSDITRDIVSSMNQVIDLSADYFDSCVSWSQDASERMTEETGEKLLPIESSIIRETLNTIAERFQDGFVGIEEFSDVQTYLSSISEVISNFRDALIDITESVSSERFAFPDDVYQAFMTTVSENNEAIFEASNKVLNYLAQNIESFAVNLQTAIDDIATAARGTQV